MQLIFLLIFVKYIVLGLTRLGMKTRSTVLTVSIDPEGHCSR